MKNIYRLKLYNESFSTIVIPTYSDSSCIICYEFNSFLELNGISYIDNLIIKSLSIVDKEYINKKIDLKCLLNYDIYSKNDVLKYAVVHNKIIAIKHQGCFEDVKVTNFDNCYLYYQTYNYNGFLANTIKRCKLSSITYIQMNSKYQMLLEKNRDYCNKNTDMELCDVQHFNDDNSYPNMILNEFNDSILYISFNIYGEYNGYVFERTKNIKSIVYESKYLSFIQKMIDKKEIHNLPIKDKITFINYAIKYNRVLSISKDGENSAMYIKPIILDNNYLIYNEFISDDYISKRKRKINVSEINYIQIDSKYSILLEEIIGGKVHGDY